VLVRILYDVAALILAGPVSFGLPSISHSQLVTEVQRKAHTYLSQFNEVGILVKDKGVLQANVGPAGEKVQA